MHLTALVTPAEAEEVSPSTDDTGAVLVANELLDPILSYLDEVMEFLSFNFVCRCVSALPRQRVTCMLPKWLNFS